MLAKAIAREAGASFINVSMSTITSKWFGEDEKNVRALFTLASKVSPTIIFVDEVDSMLGQRTRVGEHEAMRKIKNEFMTHWDGLMTKQGERILVLAATNRPFDLDEAIIRRFERRYQSSLIYYVNWCYQHGGNTVVNVGENFDRVVHIWCSMKLVAY